jgi:choice-of-anchor A domain-containing protein
VVDLRADFRDIWSGRETAATGKQTDPDATVAMDFNATVQPALVAGQFTPIQTGGACGGPINTNLMGAVIAGDVWGRTSSDASRGPVPAPFNLLVRESISGVTSAEGPLAAGGDITLSQFGVNGTAKQPVGLVAGRRVVLSGGSIFGDATYGTPSTIPSTVSISGKASQKPFDVEAAFRALETLSTLLSGEVQNGSVQSSSGTLKLTGTDQFNVFRLSPDVLNQASSLEINVPNGAAAIVNVSGSNVAIESKGISLRGATASSLLWNLPSATYVRISAVTLPGSVLTPKALLSFVGGNIKGTVVARSYAGAGGGTLQYAPLNISAVLGSLSPSSVNLGPSQPLVRGCTYRFTVDSIAPLTTGGNCLLTPIAVEFQVASGVSTPAIRELVDAVPNLASRTLTRFAAKPGINTLVEDVWKRYAATIGIAADSLAAIGVGSPSTTNPGQTVTMYQQYHQGYPVAGFGYFVTTENGIFRSAIGKLAPNLPTSLPTPTSQANAVQSVLQYLKISQAPWTTNSKVNHPPISTLLVAAKQTPTTESNFTLIWYVFLRGTGISEPAGVRVDAATGLVGSVETDSATVTILDPTATFVDINACSQVDLLSVPQFGTAPQLCLPNARYQPSGGAISPTLASSDITADGVVGTQIEVQNPNGTWADAKYVIDPTPTTGWTATETTEMRMANVELWLYQSSAYLKTLNLAIKGKPWPFVDGAGHQKVLASWRDSDLIGTPCTSNANCSPPTSCNSGTCTKGTTAAFVGGASIDVARLRFISGPMNAAAWSVPIEGFVSAHEYGHVLHSNIRYAAQIGAIQDSGQAGAIIEGVADLYGEAVQKFYAESIDTRWYCFLTGKGSGQSSPNPTLDCHRNAADPNSSNNPAFYLGPNFESTCGTVDCGAHGNATIISHWGFLLSAGSDKSPAGPCGLRIQPLFPGAGSDGVSSDAIAMVLNLAYRSMDQFGLGPLTVLATPTLSEFRDATIKVAQSLAGIELHPGIVYPTDLVSRVELAWYAVGLGPVFQSGPAKVEPPGGATMVYPWTTFTWRQDGGDGQSGTSWDFQLANGPFDTALLFSADDIHDTVVRDGVTMGALELALPNDHTDRYFWRVRPHATGPWLGCYPIQSFVGTSNPDAIQDVHATLGSDGKARAGTVGLEWTDVAGAKKYKVQVAVGDPDCQGPGADVIEVVVGPNPEGPPIAAIPGLQPDTHYCVSVTAIGPNDFSGVPSLGPSSGKTEFDTASLQPPILDLPTGYFDYDQPVPLLKWRAEDSPAQFRVRFFEVDADGQPSSTPVRAPDVVQGAPDALGFGSISTVTFSPVNATGYSWDVTSIAKNTHESLPSAPGKIIYFKTALPQITPGVQIGFTEGAGVVGAAKPAPLGGKGSDSYGNDVLLVWTSDPKAVAYGVKLGTFPWDRPLPTLDPPNCLHLTPSFWCDEGPREVVFESEVAQSPVRIDLGNGSKGRYCWTVWPILANPNAPATKWDRQPLLSQTPMTPIYCYTSGPAKPAIHVYNRPSTFSNSDIVGDLVFPYVPDAQGQIHFNSNDFELGERCKARNQTTYQDFFDCTVTFKIHPHKNQVYQIEATTFNSDKSPPVMDDSTKVHTVTETIATTHCGANETCCDDGSCDDAQPPLVCKNTICVDCGGETADHHRVNGQPCCAGNQCAFDFVCDVASQTCVNCGFGTERCCPGGECRSFISIGHPDQTWDCNASTDHCMDCGVSGGTCCDQVPEHHHPPCRIDGESCFNGICQRPCGERGQGCCLGGKCNHAEDGCDVSGKCAHCGGHDEPCRAQFSCAVPGDTCQPPGLCLGANVNRCSEMIHQGSNASETHTIELGKRSGTAIFRINTFSVPDQLDVYYEGNLIAPSGCVGTAGFVCGEPVTFSGCNQVWCCDGLGTCQRQITYNGNSTEMVVKVTPNCCGSPDTEWNFSLSCP